MNTETAALLEPLTAEEVERAGLSITAARTAVWSRDRLAGPFGAGAGSAVGRFA